MQALWIVSRRRQFSHIHTSPPSGEAFLALPIGINLTKSPSLSVGARVVRSGGEGLYGRPRPGPCAHLRGRRAHPHPRATIKALPSPHHPPSPLRLVLRTHPVGSVVLLITRWQQEGDVVMS